MGPGDSGESRVRPALGFCFAVTVEDQASDLVKEDLRGINGVQLATQGDQLIDGQGLGLSGELRDGRHGVRGGERSAGGLNPSDSLKIYLIRDAWRFPVPISQVVFSRTPGQ